MPAAARDGDSSGVYASCCILGPDASRFRRGSRRSSVVAPACLQRAARRGIGCASAQRHGGDAHARTTAGVRDGAVSDHRGHRGARAGGFRLRHIARPPRIGRRTVPPLTRGGRADHVVHRRVFEAVLAGRPTSPRRSRAGAGCDHPEVPDGARSCEKSSLTRPGMTALPSTFGSGVRRMLAGVQQKSPAPRTAAPTSGPRTARGPGAEHRGRRPVRRLHAADPRPRGYVRDRCRRHGARDRCIWRDAHPASLSLPAQLVHLQPHRRASLRDDHDGRRLANDLIAPRTPAPHFTSVEQRRTRSHPLHRMHCPGQIAERDEISERRPPREHRSSAEPCDLLDLP